jgi:hypothetical protein
MIEADAAGVNGSDTPGVGDEHGPDLASLCARLA